MCKHVFLTQTAKYSFNYITEPSRSGMKVGTFILVSSCVDYYIVRDHFSWGYFAQKIIETPLFKQMNCIWFS